MLPLLLALACSAPDEDSGKDRAGRPGGDTGDDDGGDTGGDDTGGVDDTGVVGEGCRATPAPADADRLVVVSLPYSASGGSSDAWAALTLTAAGDLRDDGVRFELGRAVFGEVAFTPDGTVGVAPLEDGSLGAFLVEDGVPTVLHAGFGEGGFYASRVVADPSGEAMWVVDGNWAENGGGLYRVPVSCEDGTLGRGERVLEAKLPADLLWLATDRAVVVGRDVPGMEAGDDAGLLAWGDAPALLDGEDVFGDDEAIVADAALAGGGAHLLVSDYSAFSGIENRVAVAAVEGDALRAVQVVDVYDPVAIAPSPYGDYVLVSSGYGDAVVGMTYDAEAEAPLGTPREVLSVELPAALAVVARGTLAGRVLVAENQGVRMAQVGPAGELEDLGRTEVGSGMDAIPGALGVQP